MRASWTPALFLSLIVSAVTAGESPGQAPFSKWRVLEEHELGVRCLSFAQDGTLAAGGKDRRISVWSPQGDLLQTVRPSSGGG